MCPTVDGGKLAQHYITSTLGITELWLSAGGANLPSFTVHGGRRTYIANLGGLVVIVIYTSQNYNYSVSLSIIIWVIGILSRSQMRWTSDQDMGMSG